MKQTRGKDIWISIALSLIVTTGVFAVWLYGIKTLAFVYGLLEPREHPSIEIQIIFLTSIGLVTGYLAEKNLIKKYAWYLFSFGLSWLLLMTILARFGRGALFIPGIAIIVLTLLAVHIKKLIQVDSNLTKKLDEIISANRTVGGRSGDLRLESGLRLLESLLPSSEVIIFEFGEYGHLKPVARLRNERSNSSSVSRQNEWRDGIQLCEQALSSKSSVVRLNDKDPSAARIALPLIHDDVLVGALLVNIKKDFERADQFLLESFSEQIARNFRRREYLDKNLSKSWHSFVSMDLAENRLELISLFQSMMKEQRFGALASSYLKEAHAIAYLDGTIAYLNRQMRMLARLENENGNLDLFGLLTQFRSEVFNDPSIAVRKVLQTGDNFRCEIDYSENKQILDLQITLVKVPRFEPSIHDSTVPTKPICFLITIRDISAIKENEKLRSDMTSLMSHELRTPITSIKGFSELLLMDDNVAGESREFLQIISNESQRLSKMLTTFLSVSNLEQSDRKEVHKTPVKLDTVVHEVVEDLQSKAKGKKIRLIEKANSYLPPVAADRGLLSRAVLNLVDNAIKYSPEKTSILISTIMEADFLRVVIEDNGYGIPTGELERIWQKFYRVTRDGHDKEEESTGLGLSFVKEAVEQHGGEVLVESEVGLGSKFSFTIPRL